MLLCNGIKCQIPVKEIRYIIISFAIKIKFQIVTKGEISQHGHLNQIAGSVWLLITFVEQRSLLFQERSWSGYHGDK